MNTKEIKFPIASVLFLIGMIAKIYQYMSNFGLNRAADVIELMAIAFICVVVFMKKRGVLLVIATAGLLARYVAYLAMMKATTIFENIHMIGIILAVAVISIYVFPKLNKYKKLAKKIWFLPSIVLLISYITMGFIYGISFGNPVFILLKYLGDFYIAIGFLFLIDWLIQSYEGEADKTNIYCNIGKHILLYLFTFGIWKYIWIYRATKFFNEASRFTGKQYDPSIQLLMCLFIPFYKIYWFYKHGELADICADKLGLKQSNRAVWCLILSIFFKIVASALLQDGINRIYRVYRNSFPMNDKQ